MIGLQRGTVQLASYSQDWAKAFMDEKKRLEDVMGDMVVAFEHVGSTAVPGLAAKPIIDIEVGLRKFEDYKELVPIAEKLGYQYMPDRIFKDYVFMPKGPEGRRTHYLHFALFDSDEWQSVVRFRDILRANPKLRDEYAALKYTLAKKYRTNRSAYTEAKASFIQSCLRSNQL